MKKFLTAVISSIILLTACTETSIASKFVDAVAVSYALTDQGGKRFCSVTKIGEKRFLTAAHCTDDLELFIEDKYGELHPANIVKSLPTHDLAILSANIHGPNALFLPFEPKLGDEVAVIGFPIGMGPFITEGLWNGATVFADFPRAVISAPIAPGNSGGGVFTYYNGHWRLVSVAQAIPNLGAFMPLPVFHIGLVSDYSALKEILNEAN